MALASAPSPGAAEPAPPGDGRQRLLYVEEAAQRIAERIEALRQQPDPPCAEIARLEDYLERIEAQLVAERARRAATTSGGSAGSDGARIPPVGTRFAPVPVVTEQELLRRKELQLDESLGRFDELLLREVEIASERSAERSSRAASGSSGDAGGAGDGDNEAGSGGGSASAEEDGVGASGAGAAQGRDRVGGRTTAEAGQEGQSGSVGRGSGPRIPPDIPDGSDDDIVARQIRAAAEAEQDPAVREKLWQEYRDYKNSRR